MRDLISMFWLVDTPLPHIHIFSLVAVRYAILALILFSTPRMRMTRSFACWWGEGDKCYSFFLFEYLGFSNICRHIDYVTFDNLHAGIDYGCYATSDSHFRCEIRLHIQIVIVRCGIVNASSQCSMLQRVPCSSAFVIPSCWDIVKKEFPLFERQLTVLGARCLDYFGVPVNNLYERVQSISGS